MRTSYRQCAVAANTEASVGDLHLPAPETKRPGRGRDESLFEVPSLRWAPQGEKVDTACWSSGKAYFLALVALAVLVALTTLAGAAFFGAAFLAATFFTAPFLTAAFLAAAGF